MRSSVPARARLKVELLEGRDVPSGVNVSVIGVDAGGGPQVRVLDASTGAERLSFYAYDPSFTGGVRVATGDINGDGVPDIITAAGPGGGPHVKVFDGATGNLLNQFFAYDSSFTGGVSVAVGDIDADGVPDIVTGSGAGVTAEVRVFDALTGKLKAGFNPYGPGFTGGVNVAVGDVTGDGKADIVTGAGAGGGPHVKVFDGTSLLEVKSFFAYDAGFTGGVNVAAGDLTGDGKADIVTGAGAGGGPHVKAFDGATGTELQSFFAYGAGFTGGVRVGVSDPDGTGRTAILTAAGPGGGPQCEAFDGGTLALIQSSYAFDPSFAGGCFISGISLPAAGSLPADVLLNWNAVALQAIRTEKTNPPKASRALAILQASEYDAVNAVTPAHAAYHVVATAAPGTSAEAAAASAAHEVLVALFPNETASFDAQLTTSLAQGPDGQSQAAGVALGQSVADQMLAWRATDGSTTVTPYTPGSAPGDWVPTPPAFAASLLPNWPNVTPFAMTSGSQFRPAAPPALDSAQYASDVNTVEALGRKTGSTRTADQTTIALFWADGAGTETPPGHWNSIAADVVREKGLSLEETARTFALLDISLADAAIDAWDAKYQYNLWRPVTAIQHADTDGNPATTADPTWLPLLTTPNFPSYTSGHSTFSSAAAAVLGGLFGDNTAFTTPSDTAGIAPRSFTSFTEAAAEAGISRIYGGIHYPSDNTAALASGQALGQYVVQNFLK